MALARAPATAERTVSPTRWPWPSLTPLEVIDVDQKERELGAVAVGEPQLGVEALVEVALVVQPGQRIAQRRHHHPLLKRVVEGVVVGELHHRAAADVDLVAVGELDGGHHPQAVDEGAVAAAEILEPHRAVALAQAGVAPRHAVVVEGQLDPQAAADRHVATVDPEHGPDPGPRQHDQRRPVTDRGARAGHLGLVRDVGIGVPVTHRPGL
jgi:hypothetical protein